MTTGFLETTKYDFVSLAEESSNGGGLGKTVVSGRLLKVLRSDKGNFEFKIDDSFSRTFANHVWTVNVILKEDL